MKLFLSGWTPSIAKCAGLSRATQPSRSSAAIGLQDIATMSARMIRRTGLSAWLAIATNLMYERRWKIVVRRKVTCWKWGHAVKQIWMLRVNANRCQFFVTRKVKFITPNECLFIYLFIYVLVFIFCGQSNIRSHKYFDEIVHDACNPILTRMIETFMTLNMCNTVMKFKFQFGKWSHVCINTLHCYATTGTRPLTWDMLTRGSVV